MIGSLKGIVAATGEDRAVIEVGGVGYLVFAGARTLSRLGQGGAVHMFIETQLREDSLKLYGFMSDAERAWFTKLQEISGVGAKVALSILDLLTPSQLMEAAALEDKVTLARANGVGPKLAARIATELKGRTPPTSLMGHASTQGFSEGGGPAPVEDEAYSAPEMGPQSMMARSQAISALHNLGIGQSETLRAVAGACRDLNQNASVSELVKAALKELGR
ncbi:Holliday junction branch migration protein RuvA [Candidatus Phycosocius spiralis]|uniref:Holliday junction branch migration complex subunit RuvA n=1 Tax=Candidatus Phycosocius spiralis TaxID=2815099 RepID=A0ABQ4PU21_9PROT|nr:Holliday junction branch migration protein RuvA [Candidatus Phycosocius spiralis]GIU66425.1 Holliday junction ATP-dependent DNA helicase RuvA [Candidatus Phycosocius spiralis]